MFGKLTITLAIGLICLCHSVSGEEAGEAKVSVYAPAKVVEEQLQYYVKKIGEDLSNKQDYEEGHQKRVSYDASTIAVLSLSLGMHDEPTSLQAKAPALIQSARKLADASEDFDEAQTAFAALKAALVAEPERGAKATWEPAAELSLLMQQVPIVNNALRRGVNSKRFERSSENTAGHAVTLAVLAQASMLDTTYCGDEADEKEWRQICTDMRNACAEVYRALLANDQPQAKAGNAKIVSTCDACHHKFRD